MSWPGENRVMASACNHLELPYTTVHALSNQFSAVELEQQGLCDLFITPKFNNKKIENEKSKSNSDNKKIRRESNDRMN